ncbi:MAG: hypothetical protein FIB08_05140 [Candidatus Methanoperedens sp.]|nr:hypothetical protein [Candidatus Methanoperedens sp.]
MSLMEILWIISMVPLLILPYGIATFYERTFKRKTYPYLFLIALLLYAAILLKYLYPSFSGENLLFALGGLILGLTSIRLDYVMTRRGK